MVSLVIVVVGKRSNHLDYRDKAPSAGNRLDYGHLDCDKSCGVTIIV
jgi:hypothetical protein